MHFCTICGSLTNTTIDSAGVSYSCSKCGNVMPGSAEDTLISGDPTGGRAGDESQQRILLEQIAFDPSGFKVWRDCECGLDFMTRIYIGDNMDIFHVCTCGRVEKSKK